MNRIRYNSPVILTFSLLTVAIYLLNLFILGFTNTYFMARPSFSFLNPLDYFRLISHVMGHISWQHLFGNLTYILLLGPLLEEKYKSATILMMMVLTALITGIFNLLFFSSGLIGASGIVFMLIILGSMADMKSGSIPLTFLLVAGIFIGTEVMNIFQNDNVSQTAHIIGGASGAIFGFTLSKPSELNSIFKK